MLVNGRYTGTRENYSILSTDEQDRLTLGSSRCKAANDIVIEGESERPTFGFVDVAASGAILRMSNCLFTEFRFRPTYLINSSNGGSVFLTSVDFINVEPS